MGYRQVVDSSDLIGVRDTVTDHVFRSSLTLYLLLQRCLIGSVDGCGRPNDLWSVEAVEQQGRHTISAIGNSNYYEMGARSPGRRVPPDN